MAFESWLRAQEAWEWGRKGHSIPFWWFGRFLMGVLEAARRSERRMGVQVLGEQCILLLL